MAAVTDYDPADLSALLLRWEVRPSHARRLLRAFYVSGGQLDLPPLKLGKTLEQHLREDLPLRQSRIVSQAASADGTAKILVGFDGGGAVESVLMPAPDGRRAAGCISSQVGCAMGCDFCASTRRGLERNLTSGEIVEQFLHLRRLATSTGLRLATVVFMGMGEPMHNLPNVITAIKRIAAPGMGELGGRQITVSTVGIVPGIDALAQADLNVHLALSLHAPDDQTRGRLIPINRRYPIADIISAARRFQDRTGRIVTIAYCMLSGTNDTDAHAHALANLLGDFRAHVNLIPYNSIGAGISGVVYQPPPPQRVQEFLSILIGRGVVAHARRPRGDDVNAACGQLRETATGAPISPE